MIIHYHGSAPHLLSHVAMKSKCTYINFHLNLSLFFCAKNNKKLRLINNLPYADSILMTFCQQVVAAVSRNEDLLLEDL